jgi:hypothetical protein
MFRRVVSAVENATLDWLLPGDRERLALWAYSYPIFPEEPRGDREVMLLLIREWRTAGVRGYTMLGWLDGQPEGMARPEAPQVVYRLLSDIYAEQRLAALIGSGEIKRVGTLPPEHTPNWAPAGPTALP